MLKELFDLKKVEDLTDEMVEQFYTYGYAQFKFGRYSQAIEVFRVLCARRPFESRFWFGLGASCQELKQYEAALKAWAMAALTERNDPYPHFHAAECAFSMHKFEDARLALKEAQIRVEKVENHPLRERIPALTQTWGIYGVMNSGRSQSSSDSMNLPARSAYE
jgi:type III secretion system low calcium response chaperone LcrH/SycD